LINYGNLSNKHELFLLFQFILISTIAI